MAVSLDPFEQAKAQFLQGLLEYRAGQWLQAEQHYRASLALLPGRASTLINLAAVLLRLSRPADALTSANAALAIEPDSTDALLQQATALARLGRPHEALAAFDRLLALSPTLAPAWSSRGSLLREMNRLGEAAEAFRQALHHGAEPGLHAFYLASVEAAAGAAPATAPRAYVQTLFDDYADDFDQHLMQRLGYQAHQRLVQGLQALPGAAAKHASALDLGCGTGLCGPLLRPAVQRLTGVDLSARMLAKARDTGAYDQLEQADVVESLGRTRERHDLVLAADVFIYIGDLAPVFSGVAACMDHGVFCFTVEATDHAAPQLLPSLRYAHSPQYLQQLAQAHGFTLLAMHSSPVRQDQHEAVDGLYVYLERS